MQIMYPKTKYAVSCIIFICIIFTVLFSVFYLNGTEFYVYLIWSLLPIFTCANIFHYRYQPFSTIKDEKIYLDRGLLKRRLEVNSEELIKIDRYILNNQVVGIEFYLKTEAKVLYLPPAWPEKKDLLERTLFMIQMNINKKNLINGAQGIGPS